MIENQAWYRSVGELKARLSETVGQHCVRLVCQCGEYVMSCRCSQPKKEFVLKACTQCQPGIVEAQLVHKENHMKNLIEALARYEAKKPKKYSSKELKHLLKKGTPAQRKMAKAALKKGKSK